MALDPDVSEILAVLEGGPLAALATQARLNLSEDLDERDVDGVSEERRLERSRHGQLDYVERFFVEHLKRQIEMLSRIREIARDFELEQVSVASSSPESEGYASLLDETAAEQVPVFLSELRAVLDDVRRRWEGGLAG